MTHPIIDMYDAQVAKYQEAVDSAAKGIAKMRLKGVPDDDRALKATQASQAIAAQRVNNLLDRREAMLKDLVALERIKGVMGKVMTYRDSLLSNAKNPSLPEATRHFSAQAAQRLSAILDSK